MKPDDIPFLTRDVNKEMPYHTNMTAKVPYTFDRFPKSLVEESHKKENKFLDNHLHEFEEAIHCNLINEEHFLYQTLRYHRDTDILNHEEAFILQLRSGHGVGPAADHQARCGGLTPAHFRQELEAVHSRHLVIRQHGIERLLTDALQRRGGRVGGDDEVALAP